MKPIVKRIVIVSKNREAQQCGLREAEKSGLIYDEKNPEVVISYGGDGTLLHAERIYPGVPKLPLRASPTCKKCLDLDIKKSIASLAHGAYKCVEHQKLLCTLSTGETLVGMNDIIFRNKNLSRAIRFRVTIGGVDEEPCKDEKVHKVNDSEEKKVLIGDGLVIATPFGSTAYFQSITGKRFTEGLGVAFNNLTTREDPIFLKSCEQIKVILIRGPAELAADNKRLERSLEAGDYFVVSCGDKTSILNLI